MSREVLKPPILRMSDNRNYRVNLIHDDFGAWVKKRQMESRNPQQFAGAVVGSGGNGVREYIERDLYAEDDDDIEEEEDAQSDNMRIVEQSNGTFVLLMHVPSCFHGGIIGMKGATKRRIESETNTTINVPPRAIAGTQKKNEDVAIKGRERSSVTAARRQIKLLISSLRKNTKCTHFVGIPLNYGDIRSNFSKFKSDVLAANYSGIDESIWVFEECIHLTISACVLLDDIERAKAVQVLNECRTLLDGLETPFDIHVAGLEIMNDDPSAVRVLYARVHAPELQKFADRVQKRFVRSGFDREREKDSVKLHMTLLNNRYRKEENPKSPNSFDAREILKRFGDFQFGSAKCNMIALHVMGNENKKDMYYKITGTLEF